MSNFKSGSGNLDFGGGDDGDDEPESETSDTQSEDTQSKAKQTTESSAESTTSPEATDNDTDASASDGKSADGETKTQTAADRYPYFVRRNNVGDERDNRLEIHVRDRVADQEATFRSELADHLGANEVAKTDAREFALLMAFEHPERVAELMQDEGFGALD
jgi:hypothetical protein